VHSRRACAAVVGYAAFAICVASAGASVQPDGVDVDLTGTLVTVHADGFKRAKSSVESRLDTSQGSYQLQLPSGEPAGPPNRRVTVRGLQSGSTIAVAAGGVQSAGTTSATRYSVSGTKRLAIILFTFSDNTVQPYTPSYAQGIAFTNPDSVAAYYNEVSHGQLTLTGNVFGWFKIPDTSSSCNYTQWASDAASVATAAGVNLSSYTNVSYAFPNVTSCWWDGLSYMPGSTSWLDGPNGMTLHVLAHELGHNFGTHHANSYWCTVNGVRVSLSTPSNCSSNEYGDPFSVMGSGWGRQQTNFARVQFGWLGSSQMKDASASGTYALDPVEQLDTTGVQALRIKRDSSSYLLLEYRQPYSTYFDNFSSSDPAVTGVTIRIVPDYATLAESQLVDATPATSTYDDAPLQVGQSLTDPVSGVTITTTSVGASGATVVLKFNDTSPPSTSSSLTASATDTTHVKLGWTASTDNVGVTGYQIYRGGTLLTTSSSAGYTDGTVLPGTTYSYYVKALDGAGNVSSASSTVSVTTPRPDTTAPSAPSTLAASASDATHVKLSWKASTDNVAVTGYQVYRGGSLVGTASTTAYTDGALTGGTTYSYYVKAYDAAGNVSYASSSVSVSTPKGDTTAPSTPSSLTASATDATHVKLSWAASTDNVGVAGYQVYRGGTLVGTTSTAGYTDGAVTSGTSYSYSVKAYDAAGNVSSASSTVSVTTPKADTTAPSTPALTATAAAAQPRDRQATASTRSASLTWTASTDNVGVAGYRVYRGGTLVATVSSTTRSYSDANPPSGNDVYSVVAFDAAGNSATSNQVSLSF
jgi:chitodextrinase